MCPSSTLVGWFASGSNRKLDVFSLGGATTLTLTALTETSAGQHQYILQALNEFPLPKWAEGVPLVLCDVISCPVLRPAVILMKYLVCSGEGLTVHRGCRLFLKEGESVTAELMFPMLDTE